MRFLSSVAGGRKGIRPTPPPVPTSPAPAYPTGLTVEAGRVERLGRKERILLEQSVAAAWAGRQIDAGSWDFRRAVEQAYSRVVWIYRAVEHYAMNQARLPLIGLEEGSEIPGRTIGMVNARRMDDLPVLSLLNGQANPREQGILLRWRASQQLLLSPWGTFVEMTRSRGGQPIAARLLPPARTKPVPDGNGGIKYYEVKPSDGRSKPEQIPPERVRHIRYPHPDDDLRSQTPLEAAGMSIEVDYFARLYARQFLQNDGRPGGVLGVKGEIPDGEAERIERGFGSGPNLAGVIKVINVDDITYEDTSKSPREAGYRETREMARDEVLSALNLPLSLAGNAANRTFDNAAQEESNWWTGPELAHCDLIAAGFKPDAGQGAKVAHDVSTVEPIQRALRAARAEIRADFAAGGITLDEMRRKLGEQPFDTPASRALWIPSGQTAIPVAEEDVEPLRAMLTPAAPPAQPPGPAGELPPGGDGSGSGGDGGGQPVRPGNDGSTGGPAAAAPLPAGPAPRELLPAAAAATKAIEPSPAAAPEMDPAGAELGAELEALVQRWANVAAQRLGSAGIRRGTVYWAADDAAVGGSNVGGNPQNRNRPVDLDAVLQVDRWQTEAQSIVDRVLSPAAGTEARQLQTDLDAEKAAGDPEQDRRTDAMAVLAGTAAAATVVRAAIDAQAAAMREALQATLTPARASIDTATAMLRGWLDRDGSIRDRLRGVARRAALVARSAAADTAAETLPERIGRHIERKWTTQEDDRVRDSHRAAHGQTRRFGELFDVGAARLRYPGDPEAPLDETIGCRCRLRYRLRLS